MQTQETVDFKVAEFDELLHGTVFCKLTELRWIMKTLSKELTSASGCHRVNRRNKARCMKLGRLTKIVLTSKHMTLTKIAFVYPDDYLRTRTFRRNFGHRSKNTDAIYRLSEDIVTKNCLDKVQFDMLFSLTYLLVVRGTSLRLNRNRELNSKIHFYSTRI